MSKPAIALYLGESYATAGLFDNSQADAKPIFEKSVFLPQTNLKNLLGQLKTQLVQNFPEAKEQPKVYIVIKYLDRLKQFRLGGSVSQVVQAGFENSYMACQADTLSLAASQLIISVDPAKLTEAFLQSELARIKKINPDLNKIVLALPEETFTAAQREMIYNFFTAAELKIFNCTNPLDQKQLRKTLLTAGTTGTLDEIATDVKEILSAEAKVLFFAKDNFIENPTSIDVFHSSGNFLANYLIHKKQNCGNYFDTEKFRYVSTNECDLWESPWGRIPIKHYQCHDLKLTPFSEVKLDHLSQITFDEDSCLFEPGPVLAGRAIKPLLVDLFAEDPSIKSLLSEIYPHINSDSIQNKIKTTLAVIEKGQHSDLSLSFESLKQYIKNHIQNELSMRSETASNFNFGNTASIFATQNVKPFSWVSAIIEKATH